MRLGTTWIVAGLLTLAPAQIAHSQEPQEARRGNAFVTGRLLVSTSGEPVPSAIVELILASDSSEVAEALTDGGGRFTINRVPEDRFFLRLTSLGFATVTTQIFEVAAAEMRNLGDLPMSVEAVVLEPLTVSAERTVVTYEADRTAYNVGVMPGTEGASVTETLGSIPELEVDIDGRVTLRNSSVAIYIDGREAPMSGEALALFLEQFPSDYLQSIEIIDNPSARYDADGAGGIINLVTKEGVELGLSGSVFANAGTRGQYGVGGRGTLQRGPWTVNGGSFVRLSDSENTSFDLRQNLFVDPAFLERQSWSNGSGLSGNVDLEVAYEPSDASRLYAEGRTFLSGDDSRGLTTTTHMDDLELPILTFDRSNNRDGRRTSYDFVTGFEYEWEESEEEFEIEFEAERGTDRENSRDEITAADIDVDGTLIPSELTLEDQEELETQLSVQVDYVKGWGDAGELELGYEFEQEDTENDRLISFLEAEPTILVYTPTDRSHEQRDRSHSIYATAERSLGGLSVETGLRAELLDRTFGTAEGITFARDEYDLFPSANLSYRVSQDLRLRLSYSRRVQRPGMSVLNPVDTSTDPAYIRIGNPDIESRFSHTVSMNAYWSLPVGTLRLSPYYRASRNGWAEITTVDEQGTSTRTYQNLVSSEDYGTSLTYSFRQRDGWRADVSVSLAREVRDASNLEDRYSGSSTRLSSRANINGRITEDLSAQANLSYYPAVDLPQGRRDARARADFGLRYRMMDRRASVRLSLRDPFGLRKASSRLQDLDYILIDRSEQSWRSAQLSVSYTLGGGGETRGRGRQ